MKKIVAIAVTASALLAGPDIGNLVDYDTQDEYAAQVEEAGQLAPAPVIAPVVTAPVVIAAKKSCCTNRDSVDFMGGYNFTESDSALDDSATAGIRYNKNIAPNTYIQLGYEHVFNSDYRIGHRAGERGIRSVSGGNGSGGNGSGGVIDTDGGKQVSSASQSSGTELDRFYLNGLYEFCNENKLIPYVFAGLGYENVRDEAYDLKSGGFVNAGGGLKYQLNENLNLITEAKALKKFDNSDLDIIAGLGLGMMFGAVTSQIAPNPEVDNQQPVPEVAATQATPEVIPSIIPEDAPLATFNEEVSPPAPSIAYDDLDVVPIEENGVNKTIIATIDDAYYIQVAALFSNNSTNETYFRKLDSAGLNHKVKETTVHGRPVKLLLVGPYNNRAEARDDLNKAKEIEKDAFIKKYKS